MGKENLNRVKGIYVKLNLSYFFLGISLFNAAVSLISLFILLTVSYYVPFKIIVSTPRFLEIDAYVTRIPPQGILLLGIVFLLLLLVLISQKYKRTSLILSIVSGGWTIFVFNTFTFLVSGEEKSLTIFRIFSLIREYSAEFKLEEFKKFFYQCIDTSPDLCVYKPQILVLLRDSYSFPSLYSLEPLSLSDVKLQASDLANLLYTQVLPKSSSSSSSIFTYLENHVMLIILGGVGLMFIGAFGYYYTITFINKISSVSEKAEAALELARIAKTTALAVEAKSLYSGSGNEALRRVISVDKGVAELKSLVVSTSKKHESLLREIASSFNN